jgi:hypothetical protein
MVMSVDAQCIGSSDDEGSSAPNRANSSRIKKAVIEAYKTLCTPR